MLIVSQDKMKTTESLELTIRANTREKGIFPDITTEVIDYFIVDRKNCITLGEYETEERAKEVFQEIIERYDNIKRYDTHTTFVYEMPKK